MAIITVFPFFGTSSPDAMAGTLFGEIIKGFGGADIIAGGTGSDSLDGGAGDDRLIGGTGNDRFIFASGFGDDTIVGFAAANGEDVSLSAVGAITDFADLLANHLQTDAGSGFAMIVAGPNSILLDGITVAEIGAGKAYSAADFIF